MDMVQSRKEKRVASFVAGALLFLISAFICVSLLLAVLALPGLPSSLSLIGILLYSAYGFSSFLVPCFLLGAAILLIVPGWTVRSGIILAGSMLPFFTCVIGERLIRNFGMTVNNEMVSKIVVGGLVVSTALALLVEYIFIVSVGDYFMSRFKAEPVEIKEEIREDIILADESPAETYAEAVPDEEPSFCMEPPVISEPPVIGEPSVLSEQPVRNEEPIFITTMALPSATTSETPSYVNLEQKAAPFNLPVIENWVDADDQKSEEEADLESTIESGLEFLDAELPDAVPSSGAEAFDPPVIDDFDPDIEFEDVFPPDEDGVISDDDLEVEIDADMDRDIETDADAEVDGFAAPVIDETISVLPPVVSIPPAAHVEETSLAAGGSLNPLKLFQKKNRKSYSVPFDILTSYPDGEYWIVDDTTRRAAVALKETLNEFRIQADVTGIRKGPVITMFEILPAPGVKLSKIVGLQDNIALRLAASSVRIVAPIPGKHAVGIEVPNQVRSIVSFRELIETDTPSAKKMEIPVVLGKDITGEAQLLDLAATPHLLIAGSTGSGKSVCVNSIILSILYKRSPEDVRLILIDPKIVELKLYNDIAHLLSPVITEPKKAFQALQYCLCEMERRYALLDGMGVRDIKSYNRRIKERNIATEKIPYLVVIIDEFADLMATTGKELESTVARLCAMSRAVGIHLVLATQRPSIDVITGLIKANIPTRIAFMVASKMDSRIIIDQVGAEKLLGRGDMLYASATDPFPVRIQGAFVSEEEVERVVAHVKTLGEPEYIDEEIFIEDDDEGGVDPSLFSDGEDPLYDKALEIVLLAGKASASYIQRRLKIGYNRAARLVEDMEARGIVGPANGSKPREVMHHPA